MAYVLVSEANCIKQPEKLFPCLFFFLLFPYSWMRKQGNWLSYYYHSKACNHGNHSAVNLFLQWYSFIKHAWYNYNAAVIHSWIFIYAHPRTKVCILTNCWAFHCNSCYGNSEVLPRLILCVIRECDKLHTHLDKTITFCDTVLLHLKGYQQGNLWELACRGQLGFGKVYYCMKVCSQLIFLFVIATSFVALILECQ